MSESGGQENSSEKTIKFPEPNYIWIKDPEQLPEDAKSQIPQGTEDILQLCDEECESIREDLEEEAKNIETSVVFLYGFGGNFVCFLRSEHQNSDQYGNMRDTLIARVNNLQPRGSLKLTLPEKPAKYPYSGLGPGV